MYWFLTALPQNKKYAPRNDEQIVSLYLCVLLGVVMVVLANDSQKSADVSPCNSQVVLAVAISEYALRRMSAGVLRRIQTNPK